MNKLNDLRKEINVVDDAMRELFEKRMNLSKEIFLEKQKLNLPIYDKLREEDVLKNNINKLTDKNLTSSYQQFLVTLMEISKNYQNSLK